MHMEDSCAHVGDDQKLGILLDVRLSVLSAHDLSM